MKNLISIVLILLTPPFVLAQSIIDSTTSNNKNRIRAIAEMGFLNVIDHKVQFSNSGTYFDYDDEGGQDVLFAVKRFSIEMDYNERNTIVFLYQPLSLRSQVLLENDLIVDELTYPAGTSVNLLYNFPFYRFSYLRWLKTKSKRFDIAIGGSLQLRNATISFESADGTRFRTNRDVGPVPALKIKSKSLVGSKGFIEFEADGIYAPISYLNGSDSEVTGAILDASFRAGLKLKDPLSAFLNVRYLGGGAVGTSDVESNEPGDGYVRNWLHFSTFTVGIIYDWRY